MCFFKKKKYVPAQIDIKRDEWQPIIDYVEGNMSVVKFQYLFKTSQSLQNVLSLPMNTQYTFLKPHGYNYYNFFQNDYTFKDKSWNRISTKASLQGELMRFLDEYHVSYTPYEKYKEDASFLLEIQPSWVDILDDKLLEDVMNSIPKNLSKTKRIEMGKARIKELFRYDNTYPRWVQEAEWPIVNGKPLVFSHREHVKGDDYHFLYHFYDPDTKEETIVEQFS